MRSQIIAAYLSSQFKVWPSLASPPLPTMQCTRLRPALSPRLYAFKFQSERSYASHSVSRFVCVLCIRVQCFKCFQLKSILIIAAIAGHSSAFRSYNTIFSYSNTRVMVSIRKLSTQRAHTPRLSEAWVECRCNVCVHDDSSLFNTGVSLLMIVIFE